MEKYPVFEVAYRYQCLPGQVFGCQVKFGRFNLFYQLLLNLGNNHVPVDPDRPDLNICS